MPDPVDAPNITVLQDVRALLIRIFERLAEDPVSIKDREIDALKAEVSRLRRRTMDDGSLRFEKARLRDALVAARDVIITGGYNNAILRRIDTVLEEV